MCFSIFLLLLLFIFWYFGVSNPGPVPLAFLFFVSVWYAFWKCKPVSHVLTPLVNLPGQLPLILQFWIRLICFWFEISFFFLWSTTQLNLTKLMTSKISKNWISTTFWCTLYTIMDFFILIFSLLKAKTSFLFFLFFYIYIFFIIITNKQKRVRWIRQVFFPKSHVSIPP